MNFDIDAYQEMKLIEESVKFDEKNYEEQGENKVLSMLDIIEIYEISYEELARKLNYTPAYTSDLVRGDRIWPKPKLLEAINALKKLTKRPLNKNRIYEWKNKKYVVKKKKVRKNGKTKKSK